MRYLYLKIKIQEKKEIKPFSVIKKLETTLIRPHLSDPMQR